MHPIPRRHALKLLANLGLAAKAQTGAPAPKYDLLIKGGRVIDPSQSVSALRDIAIAGNKVAAIADGIPEREARIVVDARGNIVTPGLVDIHVHFREPGQTAKENIATGTAAQDADPPLVKQHPSRKMLLSNRGTRRIAPIGVEGHQRPDCDQSCHV